MTLSPVPAPVTARVVRMADLAGTFLFASEGGLTAIAVGLDPVGVLVLAFLTALGGGLIRDTLIGALPPAAIADRLYAIIVIAAAAAVWVTHGWLAGMPPIIMVTLDAAGLALFAIAGTDKALDHGIHPVGAIFLGTISGTGGGAMRDIVINQIPRVLHTDIYASAACLAAVLLVLGRRFGLPPRAMAVIAGLACFGLRLAAFHWQWSLPRLVA